MGSSSKTTTTSTGPYKPVQPYISEHLPQAEATYQQAKSSPLIGQAQGFAGDVLSGKYLDPASNPYLQPYVQGLMGQVGSQFNTMAARAGRGNLTGGDLQQNLAAGLTSAAAPMYMQAQNQGMGPVAK